MYGSIVLMSVQKDSYVWLWVALTVIAVAAGIIYVIHEMAQPKVTVRLGDGVFTARVAMTDKARTKGLSGAKQLPEDKAMLFVFEEDDKHGVWMKDMNIPVDVVWLDQKRRVIHTMSGVSPKSYPEVYRPDRPARYVIEFASGTVKDKAIRNDMTAYFDEERLKEGNVW